jgi:glutathione S-transferase
MSELLLFIDAFSISPYAMSAFVALEEKGILYKLVHVGMHAGEHRQSGYRARTGRIPSIQHGEFVLAESSAIAEYLEDAFPPPAHPALFPTGVQQRAVAREVMAWIRSDLHPIREERPTTSIFIERVHKPLSEQAQAARRRLLAGCAGLITAGQTTLFDEWCLADVDLTLMLQRLNLNGDELPGPLKAFAEANWNRPAVQKWLAHCRSDYTPY